MPDLEVGRSPDVRTDMVRRSLVLFTALTLMVGALTHAWADPASARPPLRVDEATVLRVVDGDTLVVRLAEGRRVRVRLIGVDAPELTGGTETNGGTACGPESYESARALLPRGTVVVLTSDRKQRNSDRNGRLLRYVKAGKVDAGRRQLTSGHAELTGAGRRPYKKYFDYQQAQARAKRQGSGIWGTC